MKSRTTRLGGFGFLVFAANAAAPCALLMAFPLLAIAQTAEQRLDLHELVSEVLRRNPEVLAAQKKYEAARQRPAQERSLPDPMVSLGWNSTGNPLPLAGVGTDPVANIGFMASQEFPSTRQAAAARRGSAERGASRGAGVSRGRAERDFARETGVLSSATFIRGTRGAGTQPRVAANAAARDRGALFGGQSGTGRRIQGPDANYFDGDAAGSGQSRA